MSLNRTVLQFSRITAWCSMFIKLVNCLSFNKKSVLSKGAKMGISTEAMAKDVPCFGIDPL